VARLRAGERVAAEDMVERSCQRIARFNVPNHVESVDFVSLLPTRKVAELVLRGRFAPLFVKETWPCSAS
jgi:hypothetical protein